MNDAARRLSLLIEMADAADPIATRHFRSSGLRIDVKEDRSPVTEADRAIERAIRRIASRRAPDLTILGEEEGETVGSSGTTSRLIIDPIDGTRNFARGIPIFATLLALEEEGEIVAGLVSAPALSTRWWAARGGGAFRDGRPIRVSRIGSIERAQVFYGEIGGRAETIPPRGFEALLRSCERSRGFGDFYQHVLVAEGSGEIAIDPSVKPWDIAALQVIVEEAGGRATTLDARRTIHEGTLLSTNGLLHEAAVAALRR